MPGESLDVRLARAWAYKALVAVGLRAVPAARAALAKATGPGRSELLELLQRLQGDQSKDVVIQALHDDDPQIRSQAAVALGGMGGPDTFEVLLKAMQDPDPEVARGAAGGMAVLSEATPKRLIPLLGNANSHVRFYAAWLLGERGDPLATTPLVPVLDDMHEEVRYAAAEALTKMWRKNTAKAILEFYEGKDAVTRARVAKALEAQKHPEMTRTVVQQLLRR